jgi:hypothetical protein
MFELSEKLSDVIHSQHDVIAVVYQIALNFCGGKTFHPKNEATLQSFPRDRISNVLAIARQLTSSTASGSLTHSINFSFILCLLNANSRRKKNA